MLSRVIAPSKQNQRTKCKPKGVLCILYLFVALMALSYRKILVNIHNQLEIQTELQDSSIIPKTGGNYSIPEKGAKESSQTQSTCAILLFGLPRAFKDFVLPSLEKNVIIPNVQYGCDYFVHYYNQDSEASGRSGKGGVIRSEDVFLLENSVAKIHGAHTKGKSSNLTLESDTQPEVIFVSDTNETFWEKRWSSIEHYRTAKNKDGRYAFYPYGEPTYEYPGTLDNIVRQWHSINAVWDAMEQASSAKGKYRRVAMMRNDVVYITPIDIYDVPKDVTEKGPKENMRMNDFSTNVASVIPNFAKYPVNDRLIYGPYSAVKVWASQRFSKIEEYSQDPSATPGMIMHSETFLNASILQTIKETAIAHNDNNEMIPQHYRVLEDKWLCFLRVRADGAIWIEDCDPSKSGFGGGYPGGMKAYKKVLDGFLPNNGKGCRKRRLRDKLRRIIELACPKT